MTDYLMKGTHQGCVAEQVDDKSPPSSTQIGCRAAELLRIKAAGFKAPNTVTLDLMASQLLKKDLKQRRLVANFCARVLQPPFAVRQSTTYRDSPIFTLAGLESQLFRLATTSQLERALITAINAVTNKHQRVYQEVYPTAPSPSATVFVQEQINLIYHGTTFTQDPLEGKCAIVKMVHPIKGSSRFCIDVQSGKIIDAHGNLEESVLRLAQEAWNLARGLQVLYDGPIEIEWGLTVSKAFTIMQLRPAPLILESALMNAVPLIPIATGEVFSRGVKFGRKLELQNDDAFHLHARSSIVIARSIANNIIYRIPEMGALLTVEGDLLSHAAALAREAGIPWIRLTNFASIKSLPDRLIVDARLGIIGKEIP